MSATVLTPEERAAQEAGGYVWFPHHEPGHAYCLSQSEAVYEVSEDTCTCPAFRIHQQRCKHQISFIERNKARGMTAESRDKR